MIVHEDLSIAGDHIKDMRRKPLIHIITNPIAMARSADAVLAVGGRPIMAEHPGEVSEITKTCDALLLNLGNISDVRMKAMTQAAETADETAIPVVVDAVGVACSKLRLDYMKGLLKKHNITVIKGNYSEIKSLYDEQYRSSGVDAAPDLTIEEIRGCAIEISARYGTIVVATGEWDLVAWGDECVELAGGSSQMGSVTGTGCMLGAVIAAYLGLYDLPDYSMRRHMDTVIRACSFFKNCGEEAETDKGGGSFLTALADALGRGHTVSSEIRTERRALDTSMYLITDSSGCNEEEFLEKVEDALKGGVTMLQLREKDRSCADYIDLAIKVHDIAAAYNVPLIIDDRVDVMLASGAEGVHLGAEDMPLEMARRIIGPKKILGATAKTVEAAMAAEKAGADYLGVGAIYPTTTKVKTVLTPVETLKDICGSVSIPVNAIGGLNADNLSVLKDSGIAGVCAVSAIMKAPSPREAVSVMKGAAWAICG
ncbi:hydroxyethylthiazole kinase [Butyrivibrio sp. MC2013]|uniref:hydroxyethylthiazole kinase n=1 Tax=Butyrivibrio sp. MC2013 TaxID=1280686 RepID=UPI00040CF098|nr:hydroxyethylthiazole kinase [Butyrivibrio sp. MC2013]